MVRAVEPLRSLVPTPAARLQLQRLPLLVVMQQVVMAVLPQLATALPAVPVVPVAPSP